MHDDTTDTERSRSGLPRRWKIALVKLPLVLVLSVSVVGSLVGATLGEVRRWSGPPAIEPQLAADRAVGDVEGFEVDTFHYPRPSGYVVPVTAPISTFPQISRDDLLEDGCTTRQHQWLTVNGRPATDSRSSKTLVNARSTGAAIVVGNIRAEGTSVPPEAPTIELRCTPEVPGPRPLQPGILEVGQEDVAVYAAVNEAWTPGRWRESGETHQPSAPLTYVLEPGEDADLVLDYVTETDFIGRLVATVIADDVETDVNLSADSIFIASVVTEHDFSILVSGGRMQCRDLRGEVPAKAACTPSEADALLADYRRGELPKAPQ